MIPANNHDGVLPPFLPGATPTNAGSMAPYQADMMEVAQRFGGSSERIEILRGLIKYREALGSIGIDSGFQWLDGSFVEDCERVRGRAPKDVDLVTFAPRPDGYHDSAKWRRLVHDRHDLFDPRRTKELFKCDAYFIDLNIRPLRLVDVTRFWFGLFSHQRESYLWKGLIQIPLTGTDHEVVQLLNAGVRDAA